ncbi:MAG: vitamin K epoxide reductase family protein [Paludibacteraceae bacterium]
MFTKFEQNVNATIHFLKLHGIQVNNSSVDDTLQSHPDWPSLLCISDSLTAWNIPNAAGRIEPNQIDALSTPFMAYTRQPEEVLCVVKELSETEVTYYFSPKNKFITENKEEFIKNWLGVYLIAEKTKESGEKDYAKVRLRKRFRSLIPITLLVLFLAGTLYQVISRFDFSGGFLDFGEFFQYLILLAGVFVSVLLLWHEIDNANPLLHKVCTGISKGNCDAVLNSSQSKVFSWLSWSEVGLFYFAGGLFALLYVNPPYEAMSIIAYVNLLALPYTVFSIYYQAKIVKQWCVLCLTVQALLLAGALNVLVNRFPIPFYDIRFIVYMMAFTAYIVSVLLWYFVKPYLLKMQESKNTKRAYLRVKFNSEVFDTLLKKQMKIVSSADGIGIDLGNPLATNQLIKVCNPYCGPCSKAHPKIEKLLEEIPNLKVKIIFTTPNNSEFSAYEPTAHILALASHSTDEKALKKVLDDWYLQDVKNYDNFKNLYPTDIALDRQGDRIEDMFQWCEMNKISFTPTFFINDFQLPDAYDIEDLSYFLLE